MLQFMTERTIWPKAVDNLVTTQHILTDVSNFSEKQEFFKGLCNKKLITEKELSFHIVFRILVILAKCISYPKLIQDYLKFQDAL